MSEYLIQDTTLQNIGGGIRAINGESGTYSPATMRTKLNGIKSDIDDSYTAVSGKGGTLPAARNSANLPAAIESIPGQLLFSTFDGGVETENAYLSYTLNGSTAAFATTRIKGA